MVVTKKQQTILIKDEKDDYNSAKKINKIRNH